VPPDIEVHRADGIDLDQVLDILSEASRWERAQGLEDPWPYPFPAERVLPGLERGEVYVVSVDGEDGGATINLSWEDPRFWGSTPPDAGYVHRLAVRRKYAGRSVGRALLVWAEEQVRAKGRAYLRLDCLAANRRLGLYYLELGFEPRGFVTVDGFVCARFERPVGAAFGQQP